MIIIAASLYLPEHITTVASRAWFYYAGDETAGTTAGGSGIWSQSVATGADQRTGSQDVIDMLGRL